MSTTFNFPANPNVGDQFTLPNGTISQWNGTEWVSVGDTSSTVTYPLPIPLGGTAGATAAAARVNLGLNLATGEFVVQKDGTVAQPGIVFASEPGLGFYRRTAGVVSIATAGQRVFDFASVAQNSTFTMTTQQATGTSGITLTNQPSTAVNYNAASISCSAAGYLVLTAGAAGTATVQPLLVQAQSVVINAAPATSVSTALILDKNPVSGSQNEIHGRRAGVQRWRMDIGDGTAESGTATGSDFRILNFDNGGTFLTVPLSIGRGTGLTTLTSLSVLNGVSFGAGMNVAGVAVVGSGSNCVGDWSVFSRDIVGGHGSNGQLLLLKTDGTTTGQISAGVTTGDNNVLDISGSTNIAFYVGGAVLGTFTLPGGPGDSQFLCLTQRVKFPGILGVSAGSNIYIEQGDQNRVYKITSSVRYKKDIEPMQRTEMIYDLEPVWFRMKEEHLREGNSYYGFLAEDVADVDPRLTHWVDGKPESVQYDRIIVPVVAEMKKLRDRIAALEAAH